MNIKPNPAPGQIWRYSHHCEQVVGVVRGQNPDGSWLLYDFHWFEHGGEYLAGREALFCEQDFEAAEFIGRLGICDHQEAAP